ncbi:hypothetical protein BH686_00760 [Rhodococcus erythropolis]|nr:hypothetical protein BH686_00760 [Rhodococcus erythropolis]
MRRLSTLSTRTTAVSLAGLGILLAGAIGGTAVLEHQLSGHRATDDAITAATDSAETRLPQVLSYDFNTVDTQFASAVDNLTGKFRDDFAELSSGVIIPAAHRDSIITVAEVVESSVVNADANDVTLLLFLNQSTTSTKYEGPRLDGSRVRVTMTDADGSWLISDITPV